MNPKPAGFFDNKSILALVFVFLGYLLWNNHMRTKYPDLYKSKEKTVKSQSLDETISTGKIQNTKENINEIIVDKSVENVNSILPKEEIFIFDNEKIKMVLSSKGMSIKTFALKKFKTRNNTLVHLGVGDNYQHMETRLLNSSEPLFFKIKQTAKNRFVGRTLYKGVTIVKTLEVQNSYVLKIKVKLSSDTPVTGIRNYLVGRVEQPEGGSFLLPSYDIQDFFYKTSEDSERLILEAKKGINQRLDNVKNVSILALSTQYFTAAYKNTANLLPTLSFQQTDDKVLSQLDYKVLNGASEYEISFINYNGPKSVDEMQGIAKPFQSVINFGFLHSLALFLLSILKFFYSFVSNWGLAIIITTLLLRVILMPLNIFSYKSSRKMQEIQPLIKAMKEKYKGDPQKMNGEVMKLMRDNNASPFKGCLPMLLQMPLFFAFYRVLSQSVELYQAPFAFWLTDLSAKDPYYVLPILVAIAFFFQMRLTPMTADPVQKKVMMFMPIVFSIFMITMPSGLNLYILVSTVFGVIQQAMMMKSMDKVQA